MIRVVVQPTMPALIRDIPPDVTLTELLVEFNKAIISATFDKVQRAIMEDARYRESIAIGAGLTAYVNLLAFDLANCNEREVERLSILLPIEESKFMGHPLYYAPAPASDRDVFIISRAEMVVQEIRQRSKAEQARRAPVPKMRELMKVVKVQAKPGDARIAAIDFEED